MSTISYTSGANAEPCNVHQGFVVETYDNLVKTFGEPVHQGDHLYWNVIFTIKGEAIQVTIMGQDKDMPEWSVNALHPKGLALIHAAIKEVVYAGADTDRH